MTGKSITNSWLNAVKKAFKSPSSDNDKRNNKRSDQNEHLGEEEEERKRGKRRWIFGKHFPTETTIQHKVAKTAINLCTNTNEQVNMVANQPKMDNHSLPDPKRAIASSAAADQAAAVNAVEIKRLNKMSLLIKRHEAAVVIQSVFRGYLARRALLALKGVVKLQALIRGHNVRKRAMTTLQCIQSLVRVQALVCDQHRRLSCDATMFGHTNNSRKSISKMNASNNTLSNLNLEEIQALIQKAKQCSLKQGKTLADIFSHQTWTLDKDFEKHERMKCPDRTKTVQDPTVRKDRNLCNQRDPIIKTVEIDTSRPYSFTPSPKKSFIRSQNHRDPNFIPSSVYNSPRTPSYQSAETPTSRAIYLHRMSLSENSCPLPKPSYMGPTQSTIARVRSHSTPRQRPSSPSRQQTSSAKKRLSYPVHDGQYC